MLSEASLLQPPTQGFFTASSGSVTLANPTTPGSTVQIICFWGVNAPANAMDGFRQDFSIASGANQIWSGRRADNPGGETSWTISSPNTLSRLCEWFCYEWDGIDRIEPLEATAIFSGVGVTTLSTGTSSPSTSETDLVCFAIHSTTALTTISGQTNGFVEMETESQTSAGGTCSIAISRLYPGVGGTFECTATFGASGTGLAAMLVYRGGVDFVEPTAEVISPLPSGSN